MKSDIILVDRSRLEAHWTCARKRWWNYDFNGTGIAPLDFAWPLTFGIILHEQAAKLMREPGMYDLQIVEDTEEETFQEGLNHGMHGERAQEWGVMAGGLMAGTAQRFIPALLEEYEVELIEGELYYDIPGDPVVRIMVSPDLVLRCKHTQALVYHEYKTTSSRDTIKWCQSWQYQPQLHIGCRAIERHFGEPCRTAMVQGWQKGYEAYGRLNSNLLWKYEKDGHISKKYVRGWTKSLVDNPWEWVKGFSEEEWSLNFPRTLPIGLNKVLVDAFCRQVGYRERELYRRRWGAGKLVESVVAAWLDQNYPQTFTQCQPSFGERCPFLEACHIPSVNKDPLASSFYKRREPHHKMEVVHEKST